MTDPRPRPQYGEYATPEDQAKAMGVPTPPEGGEPTPAPATTDAEPSARPDSQPTAGRYGETVPVGTAAAGHSAPAAATNPVPSTPAGGWVAPTGSSATGNGAPASPRPRKMWDVILTSVLLGFGLISVLTSTPQYLNFSAALNDAMSQLGYGEFTATDLTQAIGVAIAIGQIVLFVITAAIAFLLMRRNRLAFYVPLAGAVVFFILVVVLMVVAMTSDPAFLDSFTTAP